MQINYVWFILCQKIHNVKYLKYHILNDSVGTIDEHCILAEE